MKNIRLTPKIIGATLCALALAAPIVFLPWSRSTWYSWQGERMERQGQLKAAVNDYQQAVNAHPSPATLEKLAQVYTETHQPALAVAALQKAVQLAPHDPAAHVKLAESLLDTGDASDAKKQLQQAVALAPQSGDAHLALSQIARGQGDTALANSELRQAIQSGAPDATAHLTMGNLYLAHGDDRAESEFRAALAVDPNLAAAHLRLGYVLLDKDPRGAEEQLQDAVAGGLPDPGDRARALSALGLLAFRRNDIPEANSRIQQASMQRTQGAARSALNYSAGILHWKNGDSLGAFRLFNAAQEERPSEPAFREASMIGRLALYGSALTAEREGRDDAAEAGFQRLVNLLPSNPDYRLRLANILLARRQTAAAIAQYRRALGAEPRNPDAWLKLSVALLREGKNEESSAAISQALRVAPYWATVRPDVDMLMGKVQMACNRPQVALPYLQYAAASHSPRVNTGECQQLLQLATVRMQPPVAPPTVQSPPPAGATQPTTPQSPPATQPTPAALISHRPGA